MKTLTEKLEMYSGYTDIGLIDCIMISIYGKGYSAYGYRKDKSARHFELYLGGLSFLELVEEFKTFCE